MALDKSIRGLTIKLGADTTALGSALKDVNKQSQGITKELRDVDKLLKFNPGNTELLAQKHKLLSDQIGETASKLETLKKAEQQAQEQFARGEISEKQYRALQREVIETESKLGHYTKQLKETEREKSKFRQALDKTTEGLQKFGGKAAEVAKKGAKVFAVGIAGATTAMAAMVTKSAEASDEIDKQSQKLGMSRKAYQEWDYIMSQNGMNIDSLSAGMNKLTNTIDDLSKGGKGATEAFGALGISYEDLEGKTREDIFFDTVMALQEVEDETKRAALANDLLGKSGAELAPLLNAGAGSVEELKKKAHELGIVLDDETINAGVEFTDTMDDVKRSLGAVGTEIGAALMPIFQNMLDWVVQNMPQIREVASNVFGVMKEVVTAAWEMFEAYLLPIFVDIFNWTVENWPVIESIIRGVFDGIKFVWDKVLKPVMDAILKIFGTVFDWAEENFPVMRSTVETVFSAIGKAVDAVVGIFQNLADGIQWALDKWNEWRNRPADTTKSPNQNISGGIRDIIDGRLATGLKRVPFDGYVAELHKGERVLTASEASNFDNVGAQVVKALQDAGLSKPANIYLDGKKVGNGIIKVVDRGLSKESSEFKIGKGALEW